MARRLRCKVLNLGDMPVSRCVAARRSGALCRVFCEAAPPGWRHMLGSIARYGRRPPE